jgi:GT2 family glycosyltransferase/peptidoglycan/xylan/chitin deacetylase (PgdA/CDA1 family)
MVEASIVIPSFNRKDSVCALVSALIAQHEPDDCTEVIVVLDGSVDGSAEALGQITAPPGLRLVIHNQQNRGRAATRNAGVAHATGRVVIFLDDDVMPGKGIVAAHLEAHQRADAVLGRIEHLGVPGVPWEISAQEEEFYRDRHTALSVEGTTIRATDVFAGNLSVKADWLRRIGGFDEAFTGYGCEDWDLGQRLIEAGARFVYAPDASVSHCSATTAAQWRRHALQEGRSQLTFIGKHPGLASSLDIGGLHETTWTGRLIAQFAVQFPRLGSAASLATFHATALARPIAPPRLRRRLALQSWRLAFWSGVSRTVGSSRRTRAICRFSARILCYHRVCDHPNPALAQWAVTPKAFRAQMRFLHKSGYQAVTLRELIRAFDAGRSLDKLVVITFDDGYLDTVTTAAPILDEMGFPATVFVVSKLVGATAAWDEDYGGAMAPLATWNQLRSLQERGWEIGFHTTNHVDLTQVSEEEAVRELVEGRLEFEREIGESVTSFAYPFGEFTPKLVTIAAESGVNVAVILGSRAATHSAPRHALERATVLRKHSMQDFRLMLRTGFSRLELLGFGLSIPVRALRARKRPAP